MGVKRKILNADDAQMFRELGSLFLARTGRVITAGDGVAAFEAVKRERPDVVVADLDMPGLPGDTLCRRIKEQPELRDTPVILVTTSELAEERARAVRAGADDVIAKPITRIALIQAVNRFLRSQPVRGLSRIPVDTPVHIIRDADDVWGTLRNLSRGGIFVESEFALAPQTEVSVEFILPETEDRLQSTAQVIWRRRGSQEQPNGMGLQFLAIDRASARQIESYVYEHEAVAPDKKPARASRSG
jgi:uncharacterized protein (TIGR02266 family)